MLLSETPTLPSRLVYCAPFFVAALMMFIVALFAFKRRKVRGASYLILLCLSSAVWATFEGLRYVGLELETDRLASYAQYFGVVPLSGLALLFALSAFGYERWISRSILKSFIAVTGTLLVLVWTDPLHHLIYSRFFMVESWPFAVRMTERGPLWWLITFYLYLLALALGALLVHIVATANKVLRSQAAVILAALCVVLVVNLIYVTGNSPVPNMDISPLSFVMVAISMAWGFFRYNLLDILPVARAEIFQGLNDPILVIDQHNRILDLNPAAESLWSIKASEFIGMSIDYMPGKQPVAVQLLQPDGKKEVSLIKDGKTRYFVMNTSWLKDKRGQQLGRIITFHDDTERKSAVLAERERERLQGVLEMAGAVCHDLSQPVMAILGYVELILNEVSQKGELDANAAKLSRQAEKLSEMTKKLMGITRYRTKEHQGHQIIDIDKASSVAPSDAA